MKMFQAGSVACPGLFCTLSNGFQHSQRYSVGRELSPFGLSTQRTGLSESANYTGWSANKRRTDLYLHWTRWIHEGLSISIGFGRSLCFGNLPSTVNQLAFQKGFTVFQKSKKTNKAPWKQTQINSRITFQSKESGFLSLISLWCLLLYCARSSNSDLCIFTFQDLNYFSLSFSFLNIPTYPNMKHFSLSLL